MSERAASTSEEAVETVEIIQFGMGGVGRALINLIGQHGAAISQRAGVAVRYRTLVDSTTVLHLSDSLTSTQFQQLAAGQTRLNALPGASPKTSELDILTAILSQTQPGQRLIVVDVSGASDETMTPVITEALRHGHGAVLANKRPLCGPMEGYQKMLAVAGNRLLYETTVGAALPVVSTVEALLDAQDEIIQISGTFSGTLGYLTSRLEEGASYSQAVGEARQKGYTEPDPRDDLGGLDVARKALILARLVGSQLSLSEVEVEPLYPAELGSLSIPDFMAQTTTLDQAFASRIAEARQAGQALRYVATVRDGKCRVGLESVPQDSPLGRLRGTNNMIVFQTKRYNSSPLVIQGPGAGAELTASGVLANLVELARK